MATAENAKLDYEAGQNSVAVTALTDSGDATTFESANDLWSQRAGYDATVLPNGVNSGGAMTASSTDDTVNVAALSVNLNGVVTSVSAGSVAVTRPLSNVARVISIIVDNTGTLDEVTGTSGSGSTFSETRGAAGGPPLIPVGAIEVGQVRVTSSSAAAIESSEIFQVVDQHQERSDFPIYTVNYYGGSVTFNQALKTIHTGNVAKKVYASYASPIFAEVSLVSDFVPAETTHTTASTQVYNSTLGSTSSTLNQGSFTAYLESGVTDPMVTLKNETLWFRFYPDRYKVDYILTQGKLGVSRTFPAGDNISASCTISASEAAIEVAG